jgi:predicted ATP-grasp superfamily ATP-dependent carboligase
LAEARTEWPEGDFIVQHQVEGLAASVALLISPTQVIPLRPAWQHLSNDGRFRYEGGSLPLPEPLAIRAAALAQRMVAGTGGLQGFVGVDLVLGDSGDFAIEINPRLTTSYVGLRQCCRQNLAEEMLHILRGESIGPLAWLDDEVRW